MAARIATKVAAQGRARDKNVDSREHRLRVQLPSGGREIRTAAVPRRAAAGPMSHVSAGSFAPALALLLTAESTAGVICTGQST